MASALALLLVVMLSLPAAALAHSRRRHHPPAGRIAEPTVSGVALQWYDISNQTIVAAAYPEPVTQSRAWPVSWLAAARAIGHHAATPVTRWRHSRRRYTTRSRRRSQASNPSSTATSRRRSPRSPTARQRTPESPPASSRPARCSPTAGATDWTRRRSTGRSPRSRPVLACGNRPLRCSPRRRAGEGNARPFLLAANDQFDPGPPPGLSSPTYLAGLAEVRAYGSVTSTVRTARQTDVALFWEPAINIQFVQVLRAVLADTNRPLARQARFVAAFNVITTDAQIAIYNAKFKYLFWRPVTAIQTGAADPDPSWAPLFTTPRYPDWPSGHGGVAGAAQEVLTAFLGPKAPDPINVTSPTDPGSTHTYDRWSQITQEVIDARVWEGIHFRFSDIAGARVGRSVARYDLRRLESIGL